MSKLENINNLFELIDYINKYNKKDFCYDFLLENDIQFNIEQLEELDDIEQLEELDDIEQLEELDDIEQLDILDEEDIKLEDFDNEDLINEIDNEELEQILNEIV